MLVAYRWIIERCYTNLTAREILIEAARDNPGIFSLILFENPQSKAEIQSAFENWMFRSTASLETNPLYLRSIVRTKAPLTKK